MPRIRPKYQLSSPNSIDKTTASVGIIKNQRLDLLFPILIVSPTPSFCSGESASGFIRRAAKYPEITLTFKPKEAVRGMADAVTGVQQVGLERAEAVPSGSAG